MSRYIFVADEMGTPGIPGPSNTFVYGGYVVHERDLSNVVRVWHEIKLGCCGTVDVELKWKHFFPQPVDSPIVSPLLVTDTKGRRRLLAEALDHLFRNVWLGPVVAVARKDRVHGTFVVPSRKRKDKLDDDLMWLAPVALFALFLDLHKARGRICADCLGSLKHQERRQAAWSEQLRMIRDRAIPQEFLDVQSKLLAIDERIEFLDSRDNEAVQIADFVCGVIWQAGEGDEAFLEMVVHKYDHRASRQGLGIIRIEG